MEGATPDVFVANHCHMVTKLIEIEQRNQPRHNIIHIVGFEPDIDDSRGRWQAPVKHQLAKIAVACHQYPLFGNRIGQHIFVLRVWLYKNRPVDIMPMRGQRAGDDAANIGIAQKLQAARACPIAT